MIFGRRRVATLGVLATLILGSAVASSRLALLTPATAVSADVLLAEALRRRPRSPAQRFR